MSMIHGLEVSLQHVFDISESRRSGVVSARRRPFNDFHFSAAERYHAEEARRSVASHSRPFEHFFHWLPMPTLVLGGLLENHGNVEAVHAHYAKTGIWARSTSGVRLLLRKAFKRAHR